jgi:arylsulfatase A-like enzyme
MYEGGIRVASIVRWPGVVRGGSECATPVISNDYFPTLAEAAGRAIGKESTDGVSLVRLLRGEKIADRALFWDYPHYGNQGGAPASAIREGKWKLIEWREDGAVELFYLQADEGETENVAHANSNVVRQLQQKLVDWRTQVGAKEPAPNPRFENAKKATSTSSNLR